MESFKGENGKFDLGKLDSTATKAQSDVNRMVNALENNDLAEFRNIADGHTTVDKLGLTLSKGDKSLLSEIQADPSKLNSLSSSDMNRLKELGVVGSDNKIIEGGINKAIERDSKASGIARDEQTILERVNNFGSRHNSGVGIEKRAGIEPGKGNESALRIQEADRAIAGKLEYTGGAIGNIQKQMNNNMNSSSIRAGGTEERRGVLGSLFQKIGGGSRQEKINENLNEVRKAQLMADPQMKTLFETGAVKLDKNGNLELTGKGEKLFDPSKTFSDPKDKALADLKSQISGTDSKSGIAKAELIAKLDQNADGYSNGNAAKILNDMKPEDRKKFLQSEGVGGVLNQGAIIAGGIRNGTLSDKEARKMVMEANSFSPSSTSPNLSNKDKAINSAKGAAIQEVAALNGDKRLIGGLSNNVERNDKVIASAKELISAEIKKLESGENGTVTPEQKEKIDSLKKDLGKLDNLSLLNKTLDPSNNGKFSQSKLDELAKSNPTMGSNINALINEGATNLAFRKASKSDSSLKALADENGNLKSDYLGTDGNLKADSFVVKDSNGKEQ
ncbi:MAG: hypothetical protein ACK4IX_09500, partial [Candidatus Sericytochromatia bacterium]